MRYLISFNESMNSNSDNKIQEILKFCDENLVDLLDLGYKIDVQVLNPKSEWNDYKIDVQTNPKSEWNDSSEEYYYIYVANKNKIFKWVEIKDYLIPFFEFLNDKYVIRKYYKLKEDTDGSWVKLNRDEFSNDIIHVGFAGLYDEIYYTYEDIVEDNINNDRTFSTFRFSLEK